MKIETREDVQTLVLMYTFFIAYGSIKNLSSLEPFAILSLYILFD